MHWTVAASTRLSISRDSTKRARIQGLAFLAALWAGLSGVGAGPLPEGSAPRIPSHERGGSLDEDLWGPARRQLRRRLAALTRRYPVHGHDSFVNVHATYLSDGLVHAEARAWVTSLALGRGDYAARVQRHLRTGRLSFVVELVNHRSAWIQANTDRILRAARLEVDGRYFPVESVERAFFPALDEGRTRVIHFRDPEDEHALPGPSARVVRLWFPGLPHRKTVARRARFGRPEAATVPRISFPPEMFGRRWEHDLRLEKLTAEPPERLEDPDTGALPPLRRTASP